MYLGLGILQLYVLISGLVMLGGFLLLDFCCLLCFLEGYGGCLLPGRNSSGSPLGVDTGGF